MPPSGLAFVSCPQTSKSLNIFQQSCLNIFCCRNLHDYPVVFVCRHKVKQEPLKNNAYPYHMLLLLLSRFSRV